MPSYLPDADRDGGWNLVIPNGSGKTSRIGLPAGASPVATWQTAGFGAQIVAADGVTVLLAISEAGGVTPSVMGIPTRAGAPAGGSPAQFYLDSSNANTLTYFDGTTAFGVGLIQ